MSRSIFLSGLVLLTLSVAAHSFELKPKTPDTAFTGKLRPDIVGLSSQDDAAKTGGVFESFMKNIHGVTPQAVQTKFGDTDIAYVTHMAFNAPATDGRNFAESINVYFSTPASGNLAYYITRELTFAAAKEPTFGEMAKRVIDKHGAPTAIGGGHIYYFYKKGRVVSVKQKYTEASAIDALRAPINPKIAIALSDAGGHGSCIAVLKHIQAESDKALSKLVADSKNAICDGLLDVALTAGSSPEHVGKAMFTLIDLQRIVSAARIDADALAAAKNDKQAAPASNAPKL